MAHSRGTNYKPTTTVVFDDQLLAMIEDYRFDARKDNRSQAINELVKLGFKYLKAVEKKKAKQKALV